MTYLDRARARLEALEEQALLRVPRRHIPDGVVDFASNDYLGLRRDPRVLAAQRDASLAGSGGSRLLSGAQRDCAMLEEELAAWTCRERALLFSSGYLAALGAIVTLAPFVRSAYSDALVHACAIDALRLTKLPRTILPHGSVPPSDRGGRTASWGQRNGSYQTGQPDCAKQTGVNAGTLGRPLCSQGDADDDGALFVTETLFGMDGSLAPLDALVAGLHASDMLIVDDAHAVGVLGKRGSGLAASLDDERIIVIGTLSKALGTAGGFVAGPADAIALLASTARTFVFDTAPAPAVVAAARASLAIARSSEGDALRERLAYNARHLRSGLRERGLANVSGADEIAIVPLVIGSQRETLACARELEVRGIFAPAIRPPTVPVGTSRLRFVVCADHTDEQIDALIDAVHAALPVAV